MTLLDAAPHTSSGPTLLGVPMKQVSLFMLTFQNSALILITHYSRIMPSPGDHRYFPSTAVFLNEVLKLAISMTFAIYDVSRTLAPQTPATVVLQQIYNAVFSGDSWKLAIPASLYTLQNTLQYVALGNLNPAHFQVLYQLKIIATAFFSVIMLRRTLTPRRWFALILLTIGISVGSLPSSDSKDPAIMIHDFSDHYFPRSMHELGQAAGSISQVAPELTKRALNNVVGLVARSASYQGIEDDEDSRPKMIRSVGITAVLVAVTVSGLTGVYFEKVLKDATAPVSIWTRNIQLSFYSLFPALLVGIVYNDGEEILQHGFFDGYNWIVWTVIFFQAVGGILTSLCINYADNIAKNFATSLSFIISFLFSIWFFDFQVTTSFIIGTGLVLASIFLYSGPDRRRGRPPPINIVNYEKTTIVDSTPRYTDEVKSSHDPLESLRTLGSSTSRPSSPLRHHNRVLSARKDRGE